MDRSHFGGSEDREHLKKKKKQNQEASISESSGNQLRASGQNYSHQLLTTHVYTHNTHTHTIHLTKPTSSEHYSLHSDSDIPLKQY